ncbi:hypothetical protein KSP39_PZI020794 [Platanthera zijinensis]|uniref:Uncharacterized protein n=1 Tax=Platanthera zijinensis TaxID=2320716 RepID=A0AAP0AYX9_9ASPA
MRLTPPRRANRRITSFVMPWMLSQRTLQWCLAPPLTKPLPPFSFPDTALPDSFAWSTDDSDYVHDVDEDGGGRCPGSHEREREGVANGSIVGGRNELGLEFASSGIERAFQNNEKR